jgi:hypothetical protein
VEGGKKQKRRIGYYLMAHREGQRKVSRREKRKGGQHLWKVEDAV